MNNFTQGAWKTVGPKSISDPDMKTDDYAIEFGNGGPGHIIAEVFGRSGEKTFHNSKANAQLIAAAPDLYNALHAIINNNPDLTTGIEWGNKLQAARDALAKAEGKIR